MKPIKYKDYFRSFLVQILADIFTRKVLTPVIHETLTYQLFFGRKGRKFVVVKLFASF
jgi:hypothetical protein